MTQTNSLLRTLIAIVAISAAVSACGKKEDPVATANKAAEEAKTNLVNHLMI